jgi:uncharacterized membrane protein YbhN (UPF0104 family)
METHIINGLKDIKDALTTIPNSTWYTLGLIVGSSALVSGVLQALKHYFTITQKKTVIALLSGLSFTASFLVSLIQFGNSNTNFLGAHTFEIIGTATIVYHWLTSPLYLHIVNYLSKAEGLNKEIAPATPVDTPPQSTDSLL